MSVADILESRKTKDFITFDQWLAALDLAALTSRFSGRIVGDTGPDAWREYYEEGYTPLQALEEDLSNA